MVRHGGAPRHVCLPRLTIEAVVPAEDVIFYPNYFFSSWIEGMGVLSTHHQRAHLLCTDLIFSPSLSSVDQNSKHGLGGCISGQFRGRSWVTSAVGNESSWVINPVSLLAWGQ